MMNEESSALSSMDESELFKQFARVVTRCNALLNEICERGFLVETDSSNSKCIEASDASARINVRVVRVENVFSTYGNGGEIETKGVDLLRFAKLREAGASQREAAEAVGISKSTAARWCRKYGLYSLTKDASAVQKRHKTASNTQRG